MTKSGVIKAVSSFKSGKDVQRARGVAHNRCADSERSGGGDDASHIPLNQKVQREKRAETDDQPDFMGQEYAEQALNAVAPLSDADLDKFDDYRPFFTWFVIVSQILILAISLLAYGFGPWGFTMHTYSKKVIVPSLSLQEVEYAEPSNVWGGPPAAALVRLGAKFAPCMRRDRLVFHNIEKERREERKTACCIRNDESGCVQTTQERCSPLLSTFRKWDHSNPGPLVRVPVGQDQFTSVPRTSGTVCGQDPRFCDSPASVPPNEWSDDVTKWPVCTRPNRARLSEPHMSCELIGRPCCIGMYGQCHITTQEYCEHVKGHFHEEATLCSQVSCMKDVCGLLPFLEEDRPDQFYRAFLSIFLHAGIGHLVCSLIFYFVFMRDMERMIGPFRLAVIYVGSGVGGNLASAAFVPYRAEVGPAGSILGVMASCITVIYYNWEALDDPSRNLTIKLVITALFFLMGLLFPWIDNYAHFAGFLVGLWLSFILIPYAGIKSFEPLLIRRKKYMILVGTLFLLVMAVLLCVLVWATPIYDCKFCKYFNCLVSLLNDEICPDQDIKITRLDIL